MKNILISKFLKGLAIILQENILTFEESQISPEMNLKVFTEKYKRIVKKRYDVEDSQF